MKILRHLITAILLLACMLPMRGQTREVLENRLLDEAVSNARSKAAVVARAGGRTLGYLIRADLGTVTGATRSLNRNMMMAKMADGAAMESAPTELDPGVINVEANVSLEFALE